MQTDRPAKVVINERTGTIVMGKEVRVSPVAIMHGNLTVEIQTTYDVSQPGPFSNGTTQVTPQVSVGVKEEKARNVVLKEGATVEELVRALSSIGSTPRDIIAILQSLRAAGALESEDRSYLGRLTAYGDEHSTNTGGINGHPAEPPAPPTARLFPTTRRFIPPSNRHADTPEKITGVAKQFEALMIEQMLKSGRDTSGGGWLGTGR